MESSRSECGSCEANRAVVVGSGDPRGIRFERLQNGSVRIFIPYADPKPDFEGTEYVLDPTEWAHIVATVSILDGSKHAYEVAKAFHG